MAILNEVSVEELSVQESLMMQIAEHNAALPSSQKAFVDTYGCQQNEADSEKIRYMLKKMGYSLVEDETKADIVVINTCAVREHAEMRVLGNVGALIHSKTANPAQRIVLCGCMVQQEHMAERIKKSFAHVDLVFGTHELYRFPELLMRVLAPNKRRVFEVRQSEGERVEGLKSLRHGSVKAWLSIMYGCNNFCSYCIVPYVRGRERSRRPEMVLNEAREIISEGFKDITLLGQNVNSYGNDIGYRAAFPKLIREINSLDGDFIIRFMTSHPKDAGPELFDAIAECGKAAKHIHLPFQSGNNRVLNAMNRSYTREDYLKLVEFAKIRIPDVSITSDVIVGFPGETDDEFEDTLDLIRHVRFDMLFTFLYSPRRNTPAASMHDNYSRAEKQVRFDKLLELHNTIAAEKHAAQVGKNVRVLIDGVGREARSLTARTSDNRLVFIPGDTNMIGRFVNAKIISSNNWSLNGEIVGNP